MSFFAILRAEPGTLPDPTFLEKSRLVFNLLMVEVCESFMIKIVKLRCPHPAVYCLVDGGISG